MAGDAICAPLEPTFEPNLLTKYDIVSGHLVRITTSKNKGGYDMNTIYKAIPNQTNINITYLDESLQFIGNDVESITVDEVNYGRALILDEFDSLKEIHIKRPGAVISFNRFPKQTIRIKGAFEEIRVKDGDEFYNLHRFGSNPTLPIDTI